MNKQKILIGALIVSVFAMLLSCGNDSHPDVNDIELNVELVRFDKELMAVKNKEELQGLLKKNEFYCKALYRAFPDDTAFVSHLFYLTQHPETKNLYSESAAFFGDMEDLKKEFESAFKHIKHYYPNYKAPKIVTTFTGLENDLFVSDTVIIIALEAFVGPKAKYRPQQPDYILARYQKPYIVPTVMKFLSTSFIKTNSKDPSLLADIVFFGKSFEFTKSMMPYTADSLIIGYPDSTMKKTWFAQDLIWAHFIDKKVLYEQSPRIKEVYIGERPNVTEIGPQCPGRIGQWLGFRIIQKYRTENPSLTLQQVLENDNAQDIFEKSKYRGEIEE